MRVHTWEDPEMHQIWTVNQTNQDDRPKETSKKRPTKITQATMRMQLRLPLSLSPPVHLFTFTVLFSPLNKCFTCFTLFVFVGILSCKAKGPRPLSLATGLVARIWSPDAKMLTHWKRPWHWKDLRTREEEGNRGWDASTASPTRWTRVWASSKRYWRTGKPHMLQFIGSQRVRPHFVTDQQQKETTRGLDQILSCSSAP